MENRWKNYLLHLTLININSYNITMDKINNEDNERLAKELILLLNYQNKMKENSIKEIGDRVVIWDSSYIKDYNNEINIVDKDYIVTQNEEQSLMVIETNVLYNLYKFSFELKQDKFTLNRISYISNSMDNAKFYINKYYPDATITSSSFDSDDIICNLDIVLVDINNPNIKYRTSSEFCKVI